MIRSDKVGAHITRPEKRAIQLVGPLVVRTDQLRPPALLGLAQDRAAVPAGVVKCADLTIVAAHDDDGIGADLVHDEFTGLRDLAGRDGKDPFAVPDLLHVDLEDACVAVEVLFQGMCGGAAHQQRQHFGFAQHMRTPLSGPQNTDGPGHLGKKFERRVGARRLFFSAVLHGIRGAHFANRDMPAGMSRHDDWDSVGDGHSCAETCHLVR